MATISDSKAHEYLDANFGYGSPATWYVALFTAMPNNAGTGGTEVAGGAYAQTTANWGTVLGIGFFTTLSGGTVQFMKTLVASKTINNGDTFSIAIDQLVISVPS